MPVPRTTPDVLHYITEELHGTILDFYTSKSSAYGSRLVHLPDRVPMPLLDLLAMKLHIGWDPVTHTVAWADKDRTNESFDNVLIVEKTHTSARPNRKSIYGLRSGTSEYHKAYYAANRTRILEAARQSYAAGRAAVAAAGPSGPSGNEPKEVNNSQEFSAALEESLFKIIGGAARPHEQPDEGKDNA